MGGGPLATFLSFSSTECPSPPGRTYTLIFRRVLAEDAGEIKFVAENAESRAHLRVKGEEGWVRRGEGLDIVSWLTDSWFATGLGCLETPSDRAAKTHEEGGECGLLSGKRRCREFKLYFASGQLYLADSRLALGGTLDLVTCWPRWKEGLGCRSGVEISQSLGSRELARAKLPGHHPDTTRLCPQNCL